MPDVTPIPAGNIKILDKSERIDRSAAQYLDADESIIAWWQS
jgi:hypothetical protein